MSEQPKVTVLEQTERPRDVLDLKAAVTSQLPATRSDDQPSLARYRHDNQVISMRDALARMVDNPDRFDAAFDRWLKIKEMMAEEAYHQAIAQAVEHLPMVKERGVVFEKQKEHIPENIRYTYPRMDDVHAAYRPILARYGFRYRFLIDDTKSGFIRCCIRITHEHGYKEQTDWTTWPIQSVPGANAAQCKAATQSYAERNVFEGEFSITSERLEGAELARLCASVSGSLDTDGRAIIDEGVRNQAPPPNESAKRSPDYLSVDQVKELRAYLPTEELETKFLASLGEGAPKTLENCFARMFDTLKQRLEAWRAKVEAARAARDKVEVPGSDGLDEPPPADTKAVASSILDDLHSGKEPSTFDEEGWLEKFRAECKQTKLAVDFAALERGIKEAAIEHGLSEATVKAATEFKNKCYRDLLAEKKKYQQQR